MQTIKILSQELEQLGETTEYVSCLFTRSWHGVGDFQLVMHKDANLADQITKGTLIALDKKKVAIVKHREIQLDENGKATENWTFKGWTLKGLMKQRITEPPSTTAYDNKSGDAETVMKHYVDRNFVNPVDPARKLPNLTIAPNQERGGYVNWRSRFKVVAEELEEISLATNVGWDVILDTENNQMVFEVFEGLDRSINQEVRSPVYFSPEFGNVKTQSFTDSDLNMSNVGYIAGQGEGTAREVIIDGSASGWDRLETFVDARDVQTTAELEERGDQKMAELKNELYFEAEILSPVKKTTYKEELNGFVSPYQPNYKRTKETEMVGPFVYEQDYDLGDMVTIMNRSWGVIVDRPITEFTEVFEAGGFQLEAVFGQKRPTLISKIKVKLSEYENELKR